MGLRAAVGFAVAGVFVGVGVLGFAMAGVNAAVGDFVVVDTVFGECVVGFAVAGAGAAVDFDVVAVLMVSAGIVTLSAWWLRRPAQGAVWSLLDDSSISS